MDAVSGPAARRDKSRLQTRQRLLDAAQKVFLKLGYQGAKLDDIAAAAGFTKGALYWHFPNKQALFQALIRESTIANLGVLEGFLETGATDPEAMKARLGEWIDGIDARETLPGFGAELEIESRHNASFRAMHQKMIAAHELALADFLEKYFRLVGQDPILAPAELAATLITVFKGFALCRQNRPVDPVDSRTIVRMLMGLPKHG